MLKDGEVNLAPPSARKTSEIFTIRNIDKFRILPNSLILWRIDIWHEYCITYFSRSKCEGGETSVKGMVMIGLVFRMYCILVPGFVVAVTWSPMGIAC